MKEYCPDPARKGPGDFKDFDVRNSLVPETQVVTGQRAQPAAHTWSTCPDLSDSSTSTNNLFGVDHVLVPRDKAYVAVTGLRHKQKEETEPRRQQSLEETCIQVRYVPRVSPWRPVLRKRV